MWQVSMQETIIKAKKRQGCLQKVCQVGLDFSSLTLNIFIFLGSLESQKDRQDSEI